MESNQQIKKVALCCPHHGMLQGNVEYFSVNMGTQMLVDIPVVYCSACKKYYTPFNNLLAIVKLTYKGRPVMASQGRVQRSVPRMGVKVPYFVETVEYNKQKEQAHEEARKQAEQARKEKAEKRQQYIDSLREVDHNCIILTNKVCFITENECPCCHGKTKKEYVKITQHRKYLLSNVRHCSHCDFDYITPIQFDRIREKASEKIRGYYRGAFVSPVDIECEYQEDGSYLYIPKWALDFEKYDHHHLPPRGDAFYDMTDEEYRWVIAYHQPEEFPVQLRQKSFLGEAGYSTSESEIRRHSILAKCVNEYGKSRVINQLKSNLNLRMKQKDGTTRYQHALNIWRGDIWYVENEL